MKMDNRTINVGPEGTRGSIRKQPAEIFKPTVSFNSWLAESGTSLASVTVGVLPATGAPTVSAGAVDTVANTFPLTVSAGTDAYTGVVTITGTMANGEVKEYEVDVEVSET